VLEWIRRNNSTFERHLRTYLFTEAPILEVEEEEAHGDGESGSDNPPGGSTKRVTIGSLKED
jgi:hypothetical protein